MKITQPMWRIGKLDSLVTESKLALTGHSQIANFLSMVCVSYIQDTVTDNIEAYLCAEVFYPLGLQNSLSVSRIDRGNMLGYNVAHFGAESSNHTLTSPALDLLVTISQCKSSAYLWCRAMASLN